MVVNATIIFATECMDRWMNNDQRTMLDRWMNND
jgi:hypothetical protein